MNVTALPTKEKLTKQDRKTLPRIEAIAKLRPELDKANATCDEDILLAMAEKCEKAELYQLAAMYRKRAGVHPQSEYDRKKELCAKALVIIQEEGPIRPQDIAAKLGLTIHSWYNITSLLRKSGKVEMVSRQYISKTVLGV